VAAQFRARGVPVVMGGIHATMCQEEAGRHVDSIVTGEAEAVWAGVLDDARHGRLRRSYAGRHVDMADVPPARHDLLEGDYAFGSIQTTRGCPLNCSFCSVTAFNGRQYRHRPIPAVIDELRAIREKWVLVVDDNLVGTSPAHLRRAKDLFRAIIDAGIRKNWIAQVTINMADDDELLALAAKAGCRGAFIGFESPTVEGLDEVGKKFNLFRGRGFRESVRRIQRHGILVAGSFIMGLDSDRAGVGKRIAAAAEAYGLDVLNTLFLTPLPGTRLWEQMTSQDRIAANDFPADWRYYTLGYPTARYTHFSWTDLMEEMNACDGSFYSLRQILRRMADSVLKWRLPLMTLIANLSYRSNARMARGNFHRMQAALPAVGPMTPASEGGGSYIPLDATQEAKLRPSPYGTR